jgi:glycosyltransferase involved in cell wall biosynthesis
MAFPDSAYRAEPGSNRKGGVPTIAMVARCVEQKNQQLLLDVLSKTPGRARAVFIGDGTAFALRSSRRRADSALPTIVEFLGRRSDVAEILAKAHIFALPTHWEGFRSASLRRCARGFRSFASDVGGVSEAVVDGDTGFLVPRGDDLMFHRRIAELVADPELRQRMGSAGPRSVPSAFSLSNRCCATPWRFFGWRRPGIACSVFRTRYRTFRPTFRKRFHDVW